jgi:hypothetical protein
MNKTLSSGKKTGRTGYKLDSAEFALAPKSSITNPYISVVSNLGVGSTAPSSAVNQSVAPANLTPLEITHQNAISYKRGRPSKIFSANRARLLGPADRDLPITLVETTNYDQFIIPTGVAEPTSREVEAFAQRLDMRNELPWHPIRVTPYLEVYDGKLRLAAAKLRGYVLTYLVDELLTLGDIIADRGEPRGWEFDQYCLYYAEQGRPQYQRLLDFSVNNDFPLGAAASLLSGGGTKPTKQAMGDFKRGKFRITHASHAARVVAVRDEYRLKLSPLMEGQPRPKAASREDVTVQRVFLNALSNQLAQPGVHGNDFTRILDKILWQPTEADYDRHLARLLRDEKRADPLRTN